MRWLVTMGLCVACYQPHPQPGAPCASGVCPDGLVCAPATLTCELRAVDAGHTDTRVIDGAPAAVDARTDAMGMVDAPPATATLVQQKTAYNATTDTLSVTLDAPPAAGHVLVMIGGGPHAAISAVTGGGATWLRATSSTANTNIEIWIGVTTGASSTVTITIPGSTISMEMSVTEWSGLVTTNVIDAATSTAGQISPAASGAIATTHAHDLLLFAVGDGAPNTFGTPGPGTWTPLAGITSLYTTQLEAYRIVPVTGSYAPSVTETSGQWDAAVVALKIAP